MDDGRVRTPYCDPGRSPFLTKIGLATLILISLAKTLLGCTGMAVFLFTFSGTPVIPRSLGAVVVYAGILILLGGIPKELLSRFKTT